MTESQAYDLGWRAGWDTGRKEGTAAPGCNQAAHRGASEAAKAPTWTACRLFNCLPFAESGVCKQTTKVAASAAHLDGVQAVELLGIGVVPRLVQRHVAVLQLGTLQGAEQDSGHCALWLVRPSGMCGNGCQGR